jgi:hypothetical protein
MHLAVSQEAEFKAPDYKAIKEISGDLKSQGNYPALTARFDKADTTMTLNDLRSIYYGFLFTAKYTPYPISKYIDSCNAFLGKKELTNEECGSLIRFEKLFLKDYPFNIHSYKVLADTYTRLGDPVSARNNILKMNMILDAILSSGDGKTEKTAFHVITISNEHDILNFLGLEYAGKQMSTDDGLDFLEVRDNPSGTKGIYFNVSQLLLKEKEMFNR